MSNVNLKYSYEIHFSTCKFFKVKNSNNFLKPLSLYSTPNNVYNALSTSERFFAYMLYTQVIQYTLKSNLVYLHKIY